MPLTSRIETPTYETRRNGEGQIAYERKISTTSEAGWANFTRQYQKVKIYQYDSTTINEPLLHQNHCDNKWKYIGAPSAYEKRKIFDINSGTTINGPRYGNQWRMVLGAFTTNGAASTISQSMNQGAWDVVSQNLAQPVHIPTVYPTRVPSSFIH